LRENPIKICAAKMSRQALDFIQIHSAKTEVSPASRSSLGEVCEGRLPFDFARRFFYNHRSFMSLIPPLEPFRKNLAELEKLSQDPALFKDQRKAASTMREIQRLKALFEAEDERQKLIKNIADNEAMAADPSMDAELKTMAAEETPAMKTRVEELEGKLLSLMISVDPTDSRNTIMEFRAGVGGEEAALFAGELMRMYSRYAERRGWKTESMGGSVAEAGGVKEASMLITGEDAYKALKFESGVHRVQRVPATEASGRIHTSTATVAVLPEAEEVDVEIKPEDLDIMVCRASGPGGQGVNTTDSAVQIVHKPTGITVKCMDERSQLKNKAKAMKILRSRILQKKQEEEAAKYAANRSSQIGSGDRSERIRTYNFPQGRMTDHRINLTLYNLAAVMEGDIDEVIDALAKTDLKERIDAMLADAQK
jgi:peptide chain release factor 1